MIYYFFNRQELLQKAKDKYHNCGGKKNPLNIILSLFRMKKKKNE